MRRISDLVRITGNKRGEAFAGAAIALPVAILAVMLMLRLFTFYLEVINTGISEHRTALEASDSYEGIGFRRYHSSAEVQLAAGGILEHSACKVIDTELYLINEDGLVRARGITGG